MQIVAADVGNSSIKYLIGTVSVDRKKVEPGWPDCRTFELTPADAAQRPIDGKAHWFVSSVNDENLQRLRLHCEQFDCAESWNVIEREQIPLDIDLDKPDSVGIDRLLAAFAAHRLYGANSDTIVIDCGTAMTIDLVSSSGTFRGGVIIAGPATNLLALTTMTAALPDLSKEKLVRPQSVIGRSTNDAMLSGAWYNGLGAIREVVAEMSRLADGVPTVVGTGGGLDPWRDALPGDWIRVRELVLDGIFLVALRSFSESFNEQG